MSSGSDGLEGIGTKIPKTSVQLLRSNLVEQNITCRICQFLAAYLVWLLTDHAVWFCLLKKEILPLSEMDVVKPLPV